MFEDYLSFHADYYADELRSASSGTNAEKEASLKKGYPTLIPNKTLVLKTNAIIVDRGGKILAWVLPHLLSEAFQVSLVLNPDYRSLADGK